MRISAKLHYAESFNSKHNNWALAS